MASLSALLSTSFRRRDSAVAWAARVRAQDVGDSGALADVFVRFLQQSGGTPSPLVMKYLVHALCSDLVQPADWLDRVGALLDVAHAERCVVVLRLHESLLPVFAHVGADRAGGDTTAAAGSAWGSARDGPASLLLVILAQIVRAMHDGVAARVASVVRVAAPLVLRVLRRPVHMALLLAAREHHTDTWRTLLDHLRATHTAIAALGNAMSPRAGEDTALRKCCDWVAMWRCAGVLAVPARRLTMNARGELIEAPRGRAVGAAMSPMLPLLMDRWIGGAGVVMDVQVELLWAVARLDNLTVVDMFQELVVNALRALTSTKGGTMERHRMLLLLTEKLPSLLQHVQQRVRADGALAVGLFERPPPYSPLELVFASARSFPVLAGKDKISLLVRPCVQRGIVDAEHIGKLLPGKTFTMPPPREVTLDTLATFDPHSAADMLAVTALLQCVPEERADVYEGMVAMLWRSFDHVHFLDEVCAAYVHALSPPLVRRVPPHVVKACVEMALTDKVWRTLVSLGHCHKLLLALVRLCGWLGTTPAGTSGSAPLQDAFHTSLTVFHNTVDVLDLHSVSNLEAVMQADGWKDEPECAPVVRWLEAYLFLRYDAMALAGDSPPVFTAERVRVLLVDSAVAAEAPQPELFKEGFAAHTCWDVLMHTPPVVQDLYAQLVQGTRQLDVVGAALARLVGIFPYALHGVCGALNVEMRVGSFARGWTPPPLELFGMLLDVLTPKGDKVVVADSNSGSGGNSSSSKSATATGAAAVAAAMSGEGEDGAVTVTPLVAPSPAAAAAGGTQGTGTSGGTAPSPSAQSPQASPAVAAAVARVLGAAHVRQLARQADARGLLGEHTVRHLARVGACDVADPPPAEHQSVAKQMRTALLHLVGRPVPRWQRGQFERFLQALGPAVFVQTLVEEVLSHADVQRALGVGVALMCDTAGPVLVPTLFSRVVPLGISSLRSRDQAEAFASFVGRVTVLCSVMHGRTGGEANSEMGAAVAHAHTVLTRVMQREVSTPSFRLAFVVTYMRVLVAFPQFFVSDATPVMLWARLLSRLGMGALSVQLLCGTGRLQDLAHFLQWSEQAL